jgi:phosphatidate cytidylyltransferase
MLKVRVLTALVGIPLLILVVMAGGWILFGAALAVALAAQAELYALLARRGFSGPWGIGMAGTVLLMGLVFTNKAEAVPHFIAILVLILFFFAVVRGRIENCFQDVGGTLLGILYPSLLWSYLFPLRTASALPLFLVFIVTWANDTSAYFVGRSLGRHKLIPSLSPNKTVEGAVGGLVASALVASLFTRLVEVSPWPLAALGLCLGLAAQLGDLWESMLKRYAGVKDSGSFLPGHGGFLDRFDGIFFALPLGYFLFRLVGLV